MRNTGRKTLLIGAGFSKNFDCYLVEDIFLKIFNHPLLTAILREHLLKYIDTSDFEQFYADVTNPSSNFSAVEKKLTEQILFEIFSEMDRIIQFKLNNPLNFSYLSLLSFLIKNFSYSEGGSGFIFTLNQDLLLERLFTDYLKGLNFHLPGGWNEYQGTLLPHYGPVRPPFYKYHKDDNSAYELFENIEKISDAEIIKWSEQHGSTYENNAHIMPCLIKLHGSYYWKNSDDTAIWIIGKDKEEKINSIPMLKLYYEKFKNILEAENSELYIIGYSFGDPHINMIIESACKKGTNLIIIDVVPFKHWLYATDSKFKNSGLTFDSSWVKSYHKVLFTQIFPITSLDRTIQFSTNHN